METWEIISSFHSVFGPYYVPGTALSLKQWTKLRQVLNSLGDYAPIGRDEE